MYRLVGPKLIIFIPIVIIGVIVVAITPNYFEATRILSFSALIIGEAGLSFIPVLALYPKASPLQAGILAIIYFFTTFIICFAASGINSFGWASKFAFTLSDGEFLVNTYALFVANLFSFGALILNFKLLYDEELAKSLQDKERGYKKKFSFESFQKPLLRQPTFESTTKSVKPTKSEFSEKKVKSEDPFEDDFLKPFEFEPEITTTPENLPEESSGKLYAADTRTKKDLSDFFEDQLPSEKLSSGSKSTSSFTDIHAKQMEEQKPKQSQSTASPFPPSNIKDDLQAIFEQYSSLNAVKKLTATKSEKLYPRKKLQDKSKEKTNKKDIETLTGSGDIHEAIYRQVSEDEKLQEIKDEFKKELEEKLQSKLTEETQKKEEEIKKTQETKEEIVQSIEKIKEQLKDEYEKKLQYAKLAEEEEREKEAKKSSEVKEEIIQTIGNIKNELLESLRKELKSESKEESKKEISDEEKEVLEDMLVTINKELNARSAFLNMNGDVLVENWIDKQVLHEQVDGSLAELFNSINKQTIKTNQGNLLHILLESENGTLALANIENKILTICTDGTGETFSGQILRTLSEIEE